MGILGYIAVRLLVSGAKTSLAVGDAIDSAKDRIERKSREKREKKSRPINVEKTVKVKTTTPSRKRYKSRKRSMPEVPMEPPKPNRYDAAAIAKYELEMKEYKEELNQYMMDFVVYQEYVLRKIEKDADW